MWDAQMKDDDCIWSHLVVRVRIFGLVIFVLNANAVDAKHMGWDCVRAKNDFSKCIGCQTVYSF
jgi:hypothetical protein